MVDYSGMYSYYHPIIPVARSQQTFDYDFGNNLKISTDTATQLYELHYNKCKSILYEKGCLSSFINSFDANPNDYDKYIIHKQKNVNGVYKFLYSVDCPNFIYIWIECYKSYMDQQMLRKLQKIINTSFCNNKSVDDYIKKASLKDELITLDEDKFMKFYDYCRLQYLLQNVQQFGFIPKFYNPSTGTLYFTTKNKIKLEHIFDKIGSNSNLIVKFIPTTINTDYGILSISKNLKTGKWNNDINIDLEIPNFVRFTIDCILKKNKNIESLDEAKLYSYKKCIMVEDFCKKSYDGNTMGLPIKNSWQKLGGVELRKMSKKCIDLNTIYETYDTTLIDPVLQSCWA